MEVQASTATGCLGEQPTITPYVMASGVGLLLAVGLFLLLAAWRARS